MTGKDLFRGLQYLDVKYIELAESNQFSLDAFNREERSERHTIRRPIRRMILLAAVIALLATLVGCGIVYVLKMQNLHLDTQKTERFSLVPQSNQVTAETVSRQVLTLSGLKGTPNYEAAREWYDYLLDYDPDYQIRRSVTVQPGDFPEEYSFYAPYTQEMVDKIDEICQKYHLKLLGARVKAQTDDALLRYLGIETTLLPNAPATVEPSGASCYASGYFRTDFTVQLSPGEGVWPYRFFLGYAYSPKDCFNSAQYDLDGSDWEDHTFTTASGHEVLILRSPTHSETWGFCDVGSGTVALRMDTIHEVYTDETGYQEVLQELMTDEQINNVLNLVNFDLAAVPGGPALLAGTPATAALSQTQNGYTITVKDVFTDGTHASITLGLEAPEGVNLEQYTGEDRFYTGSLGFSDFRLTPGTEAHYQGGGGSLEAQADGDGKTNTVLISATFDEYVEDGLAFPQGSQGRLLLSGLRIQAWNQEQNQFDVLWRIDGTWNFEIPMDHGDWRILEFIDESVKQRVVTGWHPDGSDTYDELTILSLQLRRTGGAITFQGWNSSVDLTGVLDENRAFIQMKDGSRVNLSGGSYLTYDNEEKSVNLDAIDHLVLPDGTTLTPHWVEN